MAKDDLELRILLSLPSEVAGIIGMYHVSPCPVFVQHQQSNLWPHTCYTSTLATELYPHLAEFYFNIQRALRPLFPW